MENSYIVLGNGFSIAKMVKLAAPPVIIRVTFIFSPPFRGE